MKKGNPLTHIGQTEATGPGASPPGGGGLIACARCARHVERQHVSYVSIYPVGGPCPFLICARCRVDVETMLGSPPLTNLVPFGTSRGM